MRRRCRLWVVPVLMVLVWTSPSTAVPTIGDGAVLGAKLFQTECAGCHGVAGDGKGVADAEMQPRPRDLTTGKFKLRSTSARWPISDAELLDTITNGMPGTAMPSFRFLPEAERRNLVEYLASIAKLPDEEKSEAVEIPPEPATSPALLAEGKQLYTDLGCAACHGDAGRGDGAAAPYLKDEWGSKTPPRDLTREPMKGGDSGRDLYLRFSIGMPGTPMPSYAELISPAEMWALVAFVQSLKQKPSPPPGDPIAQGRQLVEEKQCLACHRLSVPPAAASPAGIAAEVAAAPARRGGAVGPSLDVMARLLNLAWAKEFLVHPREHGKIYPAFAYRMPDLGLSAEQADAILAYLFSIAGRTAGAVPTPAVTAGEAGRGGALYERNCAPCHHLDAGAPPAPMEQQGPDLAFAAERYDYDFLRRFIAAPRQYDPTGVMEAPELSADQVRAIADFVWSRSEEKQR